MEKGGPEGGDEGDVGALCGDGGAGGEAAGDANRDWLLSDVNPSGYVPIILRKRPFVHQMRFGDPTHTPTVWG